MKKIIVLAILFIFALRSAAAQQQASLSNPLGGDINAASTNCSVVLSCVWQKLPATATTTTITISGTFVATLPIETSADGGVTFTTSSTQSAATVVTLTTTSLTDVRVRASAYTSGKASVNIQTAGNQISVTVNQGGGGTTAASIPGTPGLTAVPVTSGLKGEFRALPTETAAGLLDYSGNNNNATGTTGTAPTIVANTGGVSCPGNGAILLPASLNSALTIQAVVANQGPASGGQFSQFVAGNGNGSPTNAVSVGFVNNLPGAPAISASGTPDSTGNSSIAAQAIEETNGVFNLALTMGAQDRLYINGQESASYMVSGVSSAGKQNTGVFQICGAANGSGAAVATFFTGTVYYLVFYDTVLTPQQIAANSAYMLAAMNARAVVPSFFASGSTDRYIATGDSITAGSGASVAYPGLLTLNGTWTKGNTGEPASTIATWAAAGAGPSGGIDSLFVPGAGKNINSIFAGTNDNCTPSASAVISNLARYSTQRRLKGWKVLAATMLSRTGRDVCKNNYNALIRSLWPTFADGLIDIAADVSVGADAANASAVFFQVDNTHPTQTAIDNDLVPIFQRAINQFYGNRDFSSATVYVAPAAAAVATTAVTQSGNTVTVTFGATPANCQVGDPIVITGVTASSGTATGYNSTAANGAGNGAWTILTRSATQVTYFDATTGLGAASVQGTGVCPMQQDADVMMVWNFGAGNGTLRSCVGQQIIGIQNINAAASTIVPFGSETVTGGGATPTTLAANTTAFLQPKLISAVAAGCNWGRLQ